MNEKINLTKADGSTVQADLICFLEAVATGRRFIFYTLNEVIGSDNSATVKIYVSKIKQDNPALDGPISQEEWEMMTKRVMKSTIQGTPCDEVRYIPLSELVNPVSVSDKAIAMPVFHDYINKHRGLYAQSVATSVEPAVPQSEAALQSEGPVAPDTMTATTAIEPAPAPQEPMAQVQPEAPANIFDAPSASVAPTAVEAAPMSAPSATLEPQDTLTVQESAPTSVTPAPLEASSASETAKTVSEESASGAVMEPIDLAMIESKYDEMIAGINKLKEQELEAAKRYNATIELSVMHKEQHASYVQSEQTKEVPLVEPTPMEAPAPSVAPMGEVPNMTASLTAEIAPSAPSQPLGVEPTPVTPVVPEPVTAQALETNWFDMPNNQ